MPCNLVQSHAALVVMRGSLVAFQQWTFTHTCSLSWCCMVSYFHFSTKAGCHRVPTTIYHPPTQKLQFHRQPDDALSSSIALPHMVMLPYTAVSHEKAGANTDAILNAL